MRLINTPAALRPSSPIKPLPLSVSANLADWKTLATRGSDENGHFELEDAEAALWPWRIYSVRLRKNQD